MTGSPGAAAIRGFLSRASVVAPPLLFTSFSSYLGTYPRSAVPAYVRAALHPGAPRLEPYEFLSQVWARHGISFLPRYRKYVSFLIESGAVGTEAALDLACGTGFTAAALAPLYGRVCALDVSRHMLQQASAQLGRYRNIDYVEADFGDFTLPWPMDIAVCSGDSLNYVRAHESLVDVCRCVAAVLRPGGYFVFDVQSETSFRRSSAGVSRYRNSGLEWFQVHNYDPDTQVDDACVVTSRGVEQHRRVYISPDHVARAAEASGMRILDHFDGAILRWLRAMGCRDFYALRREE